MGVYPLYFIFIFIICLLCVVYKRWFMRQQIGGNAEQSAEPISENSPEILSENSPEISPKNVPTSKCKFFGSDDKHGWVCPSAYPTYMGASVGGMNYCNGGVADNATCRGTGKGATADAIISKGIVVDIKILCTGNEYHQAPQIVFYGGGGSGVQANAQVSDGRVTKINVISGGRGYKSPPLIFFKTSGTCQFCHLCCEKETETEKHIQELKEELRTFRDFAYNASKKSKLDTPYVSEYEEELISQPKSKPKPIISLAETEEMLYNLENIEHHDIGIVGEETDETKIKSYDRIIGEQILVRKTQAEEARQLYSKMKEQQKSDEELILDAQMYGLTPPPPLYSENHMLAVAEEEHYVAPELTPEQKVQCMDLLNKAMELKQRTETYGRMAVNTPSLRQEAQDLGISADQAWEQYKATCENT